MLNEYKLDTSPDTGCSLYYPLQKIANFRKTFFELHFPWSSICARQYQVLTFILRRSATTLHSLPTSNLLLNLKSYFLATLFDEISEIFELIEAKIRAFTYKDSLHEASYHPWMDFGSF